MGALVSALGGKPSFDYGEDISAVDVQLEPSSKNDTLVCDLPNNFRAFVGHKEGGWQYRRSEQLYSSSEIRKMLTAGARWSKCLCSSVSSRIRC